MSEIVTVNQSSTDLIAFARTYLQNAKKSIGYKAACQVALNHLEEFSEREKLPIFTNTMSESTFEEFVYFLQNKNLMLSTINNIVSKIKYLLKKANRRGYVVNWDFEDFNIEEEETDAVALTIKEIKKIYALEKLSPSQIIIRDYFVLGCLTGLRFSDFTRLRPEHFIGNFIKIRSKKTKKLTETPIHVIVRDIGERYDYDLPPAPCIQYFNRVVKTLARKSGITQEVPYDRQKGLRRESKVYRKCDMVSSHTGRRSMATNMFLAGFPIFRIMLITGHSTEKSFFRYIRISRSENAAAIADSDYFKGIYEN